MSGKKDFLDFQVDHMTLLVDKSIYKVAYFIFRVIFGVAREDIIYERRRKGPGGEVSMTFALRIGAGGDRVVPEMMNTIVAVVQPSEPESESSHVRTMLKDHDAAAHWQHIALRTPDLVKFHQHCLDRGVNFVTPILKDAHEDLIQCFSGEWFGPGLKPSAMFFEFVQRNPNEAALKMLEERNRECWFRDKTFLGLYQQKESEYQSGKIEPFFDDELVIRLEKLVEGKQVFDITEEDVADAERLMLDYAKQKVA